MDERRFRRKQAPDQTTTPYLQPEEIPPWDPMVDPLFKIFDYTDRQGDIHNYLIDFENICLKAPEKGPVIVQKLLDFTLKQHTEALYVMKLLDAATSFISGANSSPPEIAHEHTAQKELSLKLIEGVNTFLGQGSSKIFTHSLPKDGIYEDEDYSNEAMRSLVRVVRYFEQNFADGKPHPSFPSVNIFLKHAEQIARDQSGSFLPFIAMKRGEKITNNANLLNQQGVMYDLMRTIAEIEEQDDFSLPLGDFDTPLKLIHVLDIHRNQEEVQEIRTRRFGSVTLDDLLKTKEQGEFNKKALTILANLPPGDAFYQTFFEGLLLGAKIPNLDDSEFVNFVNGTHPATKGIKIRSTHVPTFLKHHFSFHGYLTNQLLLPAVNPRAQDFRFDTDFNRILNSITSRRVDTFVNLLYIQLCSAEPVGELFEKAQPGASEAFQYPLWDHVSLPEHKALRDYLNLHEWYNRLFLSNNADKIISNLQARFGRNRNITQLVKGLDLVRHQTSRTQFLTDYLSQFPPATAENGAQAKKSIETIRPSFPENYTEILNFEDHFEVVLSVDDELGDRSPFGLKTIMHRARPNKEGLYFFLEFEHPEGKTPRDQTYVIHGFTDKKGAITFISDLMPDDDPTKAVLEFFVFNSIVRMTLNTQLKNLKDSETIEPDERTVNEYFEQFWDKKLWQ